MRAALSCVLLLILSNTSLSAAEAKGTFFVKMIPIAPAVGDNSTVGHMQLSKTYSGAITGTGAGHMLMVRTATKGSAGYVAIEKVDANLGGKTGTFLLQHNGMMDRGESSLSITLVPDSADGELLGLSGTMTIEKRDGNHHYTLDYSLPDPE